MLPLQNIFQSINAIQASTPPSFAVQGGATPQFGNPSLLGGGQTGFPTSQQQAPFGSQFGSSQLLGNNGLNATQGQFIPSSLAFGQQPTGFSPQNGQIDLRNPQARQALIQQLGQVAATLDPRSSESQQVQARIAALNNVNPDGSFNQVGQLFQQLSGMEIESPEAQRLMSQISALQQQQKTSASSNNPLQTPQAVTGPNPFQQSPVPQAFGQQGTPFQVSSSAQADPMLALMQGFMQMMGMMFTLLSSR